MKKVLLLLLLPVIASAAKACDPNNGQDNTPAPEIASFVTEYDGKAVAGEQVQIIGSNFSSTPSDNKVLCGVGLDAVPVDVTEASETRLVFIAPALGKDQVHVKVSTKGKESNYLVLVYTVKPVVPDEPQDPDDPVEEPWDDKPTISLPGATTVTVCPGVEWTTFHGTWEGQIRNINIVRTTLNEHNHLGLYFNYGQTYPDGYTPELGEDEDPRDLDKKCIYLDAVAGTNGPMACCHFVRVDGVVKHVATDTDPWIANCALVIDGDVVDIVKVKDNYKAARLNNNTVGCAGPLLVWEGKIQENSQEWLKADTDKWLTSTHPRTAIGFSKDLKTVVQVAVDGRWTQSSSEERAIGMSTELLAKLMRGLGCYKAMNFDGGGGTAMWVYGQGNSRNIVNRVCENRWDWNGTKLRPTGNAVYIKSDLK